MRRGEGEKRENRRWAMKERVVEGVADGSVGVRVSVQCECVGCVY